MVQHPCRFRLRATCRFAALLVLLVTNPAAFAQDLFNVSAQTTSGTPQTVNVAGSNLTDLVSQLIRNQDQFSTLQNRDISASLRYANISNAITIQKNATSTSASVIIPSIGLNKTFVAANSDDLKNQIIDYVKNNGATVYGKFLRVVNEQSDVGVTDGNPLAATAMLADHQYFTFGIDPAPFEAPETPNRLDSVSTPRFRFDAGGGIEHTRIGDGYFVRGALDTAFRFTDQLGLVFSTPFVYRNIEGGNIYQVGEEVALPIGIIPGRGNGGLAWTLAPYGTVGAAGSVELAAGGTFAGGGVTSSLAYTLGGFTFTLADHFSFFRGYPVHFGDYHFHTDLQQQVLKNGLKVSKTFAGSVVLDAQLTYTNFLERADIRDYWSPGAGVSLRFGAHAGLRVGYQADLAGTLRVHEGDLFLYVNY